MGYEEDWVAASETFKAPRGILSYSFVGASTNITTWKVTGNLGGESVSESDTLQRLCIQQSGFCSLPVCRPKPWSTE
jgi:hypothetical protein